MSDDDYGPIIGGRAREPRQIRILPCPCGADAVWYWPTNADLPTPPDGLPPNLCEGCFPQAVPESARDDWRRVPPPEEW